MTWKGRIEDLRRSINRREKITNRFVQLDCNRIIGLWREISQDRQIRELVLVSEDQIHSELWFLVNLILLLLC